MSALFAAHRRPPGPAVVLRQLVISAGIQVLGIAMILPPLRVIGRGEPRAREHVRSKYY